MDAQALLGVALGMVVVYFLMAVVCSFSLETVYAISNLRGRALSKFLEQMLRGTDAARLPEDIWTKLDLFKHPIIEGLKKPEWFLRGPQTEPSYIPATSIAQALIDKLWKNYGEHCIPIDDCFRTAMASMPVDNPLRIRLSQTSGSQLCLIDIEPQTISSIILHLPNTSVAKKPLTDFSNGFQTPRELTFEMLEAIVNSHKLGTQLTQALRAILFEAQGDLKKVYLGIERWYDAVMDRATGWFKRHSLMILGFSAFAIAVAFNINTITIAKTLYENKDARNAFEQLAVGLQEKGYSANDNKKIPIIYLLAEHHIRLQGELSKSEVTAYTGALIAMLHSGSSTKPEPTKRDEQTGLEEICTKSILGQFRDLLKTSCNLHLGIGVWENNLSAWRAEIFRIVNEYQKITLSLTKSAELLDQFEPIWKSNIAIKWQTKTEQDLYYTIQLNKIAIFLSSASLILMLLWHLRLAWVFIWNAKITRTIRTKLYKITFIRNSKEKISKLGVRLPSAGLNSRGLGKLTFLLIVLCAAWTLNCIYQSGHILTPSFWAWLAGVVLTAIMASFGAPFWFDLLNKLVNRRAAGPKPAGSESMFG